MRKPVAMIATLLFLAIWIAGAATIGTMMTEWPRALQLLFYVVAGVAWVFPLKPLFGWMNSPTKTD